MSPQALATLNAALNATAFLLMTLGYRAIRREEPERHRALMLGAFTASCLFLLSYATRMALYGDTAFGGTGWLRTVYLAILGGHVLFALAAAPMVVTSLVLALGRRQTWHRRIARLTLPLWAFVSVSGVAVYLMLYHLLPP